jgi:hypothetical protein
MPVAAQDAPRVIFCKGECFAVDARGIRAPAPKGTQLREGQRIETGPGAYVQLKLGPDAALGVSERARVRFDQRSVRDRNLVMLDQGRIRIVAGEAIGKLTTRALELRTSDGAFALRNADIEVKKPDTASTGPSLTYMKLNAGDARLQSGPNGDTAIDKQGVQGITAGKVITDKSFSVAEVALVPSQAGATAVPGAIPPVASPLALIGGSRTLPVPIIPPPPMPTVLPLGDRILNTPVRLPDGKTVPNLGAAVGILAVPITTPGTAPLTTPVTPVVTLAPVITAPPNTYTLLLPAVPTL